MKFVVFLFIFPVLGLCQTGPGGVGTIDGTSSLEVWLCVEYGVEEAVADPAESGDTVTRWLDKSGYNNHATVPATFLSPTFTTYLGSNVIQYCIWGKFK